MPLVVYLRQLSYFKDICELLPHGIALSKGGFMSKVAIIGAMASSPSSKCQLGATVVCSCPGSDRVHRSASVALAGSGDNGNMLNQSRIKSVQSLLSADERRLAYCRSFTRER